MELEIENELNSQQQAGKSIRKRAREESGKLPNAKKQRGKDGKERKRDLTDKEICIQYIKNLFHDCRGGKISFKDIPLNVVAKYFTFFSNGESPENHTLFIKVLEKWYTEKISSLTTMYKSGIKYVIDPNSPKNAPTYLLDENNQRIVEFRMKKDDSGQDVFDLDKKGNKITKLTRTKIPNGRKDIPRLQTTDWRKIAAHMFIEEYCFEDGNYKIGPIAITAYLLEGDAKTREEIVLMAKQYGLNGDKFEN